MKEILKMDLETALNALMPEAMEWFRRMVEINSFTTNREGVNQIGALTAECFASMGFTAEFVESENRQHGRHLFLSRGDTSLKPVVLVSHLDTVFPAEEEKKNEFHWRVVPEEGRIYGPGTVDIKGGTVLVWLQLQALKRVLPELFENTRWMIAINASEEAIGAEFGQRTAERAPRGARAVLVFEGGPREGHVFHVVTSRKGRALYRLHGQGRAAHAGSAHAEGANAIVALAEAVQAAAQVTDYGRGLTVNVGVIAGGSVVNRVPQEAFADMEMRAFEPLVLEDGCRRIEALEAFCVSAGGATIRVESTGTSPAWPASSETKELAQHWEVAARTLGVSVKQVARGGLSDANYLCTLGPTLDGLGPSGANAHCSERSTDGRKVPEYVEPSSFVPKAMLNIFALKSLLGDV
jgi:glutamate carboxypeptidase